MIQKEDEKIAEMFDDPRRSNAFYKIASLAREGLIDEETLKEFSEETQEKLRIIMAVDIYQSRKR
jgi:hypothetical protein